ncbi:MAG: glycerol dehydratase reactivase beta/small subunit family protein [Peptostreptococcaceae bacterium]|nr:glycerol dehydratase reactivase beta/small subunit family protein [Peptostreptococcaceae bacterium]
MVPTKTVKPSIKIFANSEIRENIYNELLLGVEEEGIPYDLEIKRGNALDMAFEAADISILDVGIGITNDEIILHFSKLNKEKPLFKIPLDSSVEKIRNIGSNGARLVKKMPFKGLL